MSGLALVHGAPLRWSTRRAVDDPVASGNSMTHRVAGQAGGSHVRPRDESELLGSQLA